MFIPFKFVFTAQAFPSTIYHRGDFIIDDANN